MRWGMGSQWRSVSSGVMWSYSCAPTVSRAAALMTDCSQWSRSLRGRPRRVRRCGSPVSTWWNWRWTSSVSSVTSIVERCSHSIGPIYCGFVVQWVERRKYGAEYLTFGPKFVAIMKKYMGLTFQPTPVCCYNALYSCLFTELVAKINNETTRKNNNKKLNYKTLTKYYKLIQNLQELFTVDLCRNINLSCLFLKTQLGRSIAK